MKKLLPIAFFIVLFTGIYSCKKDPAPPLDLGYNYFPNEVGTYVVYNVDSIDYNAITMNPATHITAGDTFKFQLKEKIQSTFIDNEGRTALRLERYVKMYNPSVPYSAMSWTLRDVWSEIRTLRVAEKVEENVCFVKLAFPIKESQIWNGHAKNTLPARDYSYTFFDFPRTIGGVVYDSVLEVKHREDLSLITDSVSNEKYARNVGLIYKRYIAIDSQPDPDWSLPSYPFGSDTLAAFYAKPILKRVHVGSQYTWTVAYFGKE